jgi:hypothetical protein
MWDFCEVEPSGDPLSTQGNDPATGVQFMAIFRCFPETVKRVALELKLTPELVRDAAPSLLDALIGGRAQTLFFKKGRTAEDRCESFASGSINGTRVHHQADRNLANPMSTQAGSSNEALGSVTSPSGDP